MCLEEKIFVIYSYKGKQNHDLERLICFRSKDQHEHFSITYIQRKTIEGY